MRRRTKTSDASHVLECDAFDFNTTDLSKQGVQLATVDDLPSGGLVEALLSITNIGLISAAYNVEDAEENDAGVFFIWLDPDVFDPFDDNLFLNVQCTNIDSSKHDVGFGCDFEIDDNDLGTPEAPLWKIIVFTNNSGVSTSTGFHLRVCAYPGT